MVEIRPMRPADLMTIEPQISQQFTLGIDTRGVTREEAEELAVEKEAWAIFDNGQLVACFGIRETFPGVQGVAWATLAAGIGGAHLAMTRFARSRIIASPLRRIEAIVLAADAESVLDIFPMLDAQQLLEAVMATPTPECIWARLCGLHPAHVLRKFGLDGQSYILFERVS